MRQFRISNLSFIGDKIAEFTVNNFNAVTTSILSMITQININIKSISTNTDNIATNTDNIATNTDNIATVKKQSNLSAIYTKRVNTSDPALAGEFTLDTGSNTIKIYGITKNNYTLDLAGVKRIELIATDMIATNLAYIALSDLTINFASNIYTITYASSNNGTALVDGSSGYMIFNCN